jgi:hypothetical protein
MSEQLKQQLRQIGQGSTGLTKPAVYWNENFSFYETSGTAQLLSFECSPKNRAVFSGSLSTH